ncbi:hypothetical protein EYZ11_005108 [Aspergillus tanneri]|uniref:Uncharacterized protein n=1 Tax=Aspergillus tanneri TaxID=1220188 RepID=A0A4S3JPN6_9EURO|nr:hypothetical protein EYZ11_005108 [Aspergillus tanneri]
MGKSIYFYNPSLGASILFTILYLFPTGYHLYTTILAPRKSTYNRAGYFIPILIGAGLEVAGALRDVVDVDRDCAGIYLREFICSSASIDRVWIWIWIRI